MRKTVPGLDPLSIPGLSPRPEPIHSRPRPGPEPRPGPQPQSPARTPQAAAGPDPGPDPDELRYLILAAQREGSRRHATRLRNAGLTPAQAEVLEVLRASATLTLAELGRLLVCETGSPSRLVATLVQRGLVARVPGASDRRVVSLGLTPAGHEALTGSAGSAPRDAITARLTGYEIGQLTGLLRKLVAGTAGGAAVATRFPPGRD